MANVSTSTKGVHKKLFSDISLTDDQSLKKIIMDLEQLTPLSVETGISVDPTVRHGFTRNFSICR